MPDNQPDRYTKISKFLSLFLRHQPAKIGLQLDSAGWISVAVLLQACNQHGFPMTLDELETVVATSDKQRFAFSEDGAHVRANQGHSVQVDLGYQTIEPPPILYHGTADRFLPSIKQKGLIKGQRHHVHLSADRVTAEKVGVRHGKPIILEVLSERMHQDGYLFYQAENGVWLTEHIPVDYLVF